MKKFTYRLEPVLKIKSHLEKERQKEHAVALQQVMLQQEKLAGIEAERQQTFDCQREHLVGKIQPQQLLSASRYLVKLKRDTVTGSELLRGLEREAEVRRQRLIEATKQKKIYEKHKERKKTQLLQEIEDHEKKALDEIAVISFSYNQRQ